MAEHISDETIVEYAANRLSEADHQAVDKHTEECEACQNALAKIVGRSSTPFAAAITRPSSAFGQRDTEPAVGMPKVGDRLDERFTICRHLGRGGMGHVYQATDEELGIQVALKVLRPEISADEEQVRHLRREILAGRKIAHPNVCRVFDLGKADRFYFITMELINGATLAEPIKAGAVPEASAFELLRQLLSALAIAHGEGIVHRDLKPANVMLDEAGKVKVMDFGLARDLTGEHSLQGQIGTPLYWSPEQGRGEAAGPPADVYAVGLMAYQLFTGDATPRKRDMSRVPEPYRAWIERCLRDMPEQRYADAQAALSDLVAVPTRAAGRTRRTVATIGITAAVAAIAFGVTIWTVKTRDERPAAAPEPSTATNAVPAASADAAAPTPDAAPSVVATDVPVASTTDAGVPPAHDAGVTKRTPRDAGAIAHDAAKLSATDASLLYEP